MRIIELKREINDILKDLENPHLETRVLLSHFLSLTTAELILKEWDELSDEKACLIRDAAIKRKSGKPMAYITGEKEFYGYTFRVNENTLIPRPDTETLVETAISLIKEKKDPSLLDICTGSGAIVTAIKREKKDIDAHFSDISIDALRVAKENYERLTGEKGDGRISDLFASWNGFKFDIITANPPYVSPSEYSTLDQDVKSEPILALLDPSPDGLGIIRKIIREGKNYLKDNGLILIESDSRQTEEIRKLFKDNGYQDIHTVKDLSEKERVTYARKEL